MTDLSIVRRGGGGTSLNFEVVGGASAPASPKVNSIWVNTDTAISSWHFGADEPNVYKLKTRTESDAHTIMAPHKLSAGDILNFEIPATVFVTREAICVKDPETEKKYYVRQSASAVSAWSAGIKVGVKILDESYPVGSYGSDGGTARLLKWADYYHDEGAVWIQTGNSSPVEFNALKKNSIHIYPLSAKQYVGGAWVDKDAKSYQSGAWVDWIPAGALYYFGDTCDSVSGGWNARGWKYNNSDGYQAVAPQMADKSGYMEVVPPAGNFACGVIEVKTDQNLSSVNHLVLDFEADIYQCGIDLIVISRSASVTMQNEVSTKELTKGAAGSTVKVSRSTISLDVSGITGSYDIAIRFMNSWSGSASGTFKMYSLVKE